MTIFAFISENSPVRLWSLNSAERLQRQLREISKESYGDSNVIHWLNNIDDAPSSSQVLLLNGSFLFETRTLKGVLERLNSILQHTDHTPAAAFIDAGRLQEVLAYMTNPDQRLPEDLQVVQTWDMEAFDESLRRAITPMLEPVNTEHKNELENSLYGNAYKGITDLVTKFVWPKPAKLVVHLCATMRISPNMVTTLGLLLVVAACYLFLNGFYGWGLVAGWIMTFLDTVDGKLARVTIQSSKFGHLFDHVIDLFHPPFWYIFWGMSLLNFQTVLGQGLLQMYWIIVLAYVAGRVVEGIFPLLGNCSIFTWRPIDAWFRLVTARRNPCMILLTISLLIGKPEWGFVAVTFWSAFSSVILILRLTQAFIIRLKRGPLDSWLSESNVANGPNAYSYSIFGTTRGAYARQ